MLRFSLIIAWTLLVQVTSQDKRRKPCAPNENGEMDFRAQKGVARIPSVTNETVFCTEGKASGFPCDGVDLEAFLNIADLAAGATVQGSPVSVGGGLNE